MTVDPRISLGVKIVVWLTGAVLLLAFAGGWL